MSRYQVMQKCVKVNPETSTEEVVGFILKDKQTNKSQCCTLAEVSQLLPDIDKTNLVVMNTKPYLRRKEGIMPIYQVKPRTMGLEDLLIYLNGHLYKEDSMFKALVQIEPLFKGLYNFDQKNAYHVLDAWGHTKGVVTNLCAEPIALQLAALYHDIAKPTCFTETNGERSFISHEKLSAEIAEKSLTRLGVPQDIVTLICTLIAYHGTKLMDIRDTKLIAMYTELGEPTFNMLLKLKDADIRACKPGIPRETTEEVVQRIRELQAQAAKMTTKDLKITSQYLMSKGIKGPDLGKTLNTLVTLVEQKVLANTPEALMAHVDTL